MPALFVMALAALAADAGTADRFTLVADGQAKAQIVTGGVAPETVRFAARELQTFVAKMSGAQLPIAAQAAPGVPAIRLGPAARAVLAPDQLQDIRRDGYVIAVAKGDRTATRPSERVAFFVAPGLSGTMGEPAPRRPMTTYPQAASS